MGTTTGLEAPRVSRRDVSIWSFLTFASGYWNWRGKTGRRAWRLAVVIVGLVLLNLLVNLGLNQWYRWFFDTLERREAAQLIPAVMALAALIISGAAFAVAMVYCQMMLQLGWRRWATGILINRWDKKSNGGNPLIDGGQPPVPHC